MYSFEKAVILGRKDKRESIECNCNGYFVGKWYIFLARLYKWTLSDKKGRSQARTKGACKESQYFPSQIYNLFRIIQLISASHSHRDIFIS
jgi:hypothetical protein